METRESNVSQKKLGVVSTASFDTLITAVLSKSEKAQSTFCFRFIDAIDGEVLAALHKYSEKEIKRRVKAGTNAGRPIQQSNTDISYPVGKVGEDQTGAD